MSESQAREFNAMLLRELLEVARLQQSYLRELELRLVKLIKTPSDWQLVNPKQLHALVKLGQPFFEVDPHHEPEDASIIWKAEQ